MFSATSGLPTPAGRGSILLLLVLFAGCALRGHAPPVAGYERGGVPDLSGQGVIVLPLQRSVGVHPDLGRELEYALGAAGERIGWVWSGALQEALRTSPGLGIRLDALPIAAFQRGEVERIGDPLFGDLYRMGVLVDAAYALLPIEARAGQRDGGQAVELSVALLDTRSGRVVWFGIMEGGAGDPGALFPAATAAEALARRIIF